MRSREVRRLGVVDITDPQSVERVTSAASSVRGLTPVSREAVAREPIMEPADEPVVEAERPPPPRQPLVGREAPSARRQVDPEQIVRHMAALDPYLETIDDELFCAFCDARGGAHTRECVWLMADLWTRRNSP